MNIEEDFGNCDPVNDMDKVFGEERENIYNEFYLAVLRCRHL
jgi:hypothetical protein